MRRSQTLTTNFGDDVEALIIRAQNTEQRLKRLEGNVQCLSQRIRTLEQSRQDDVKSQLKLIRVLERNFSSEELETLAYDLGLDLNDVTDAETKANRVRDLVGYLARRGREMDLVDVVREARPRVDI